MRRSKYGYLLLALLVITGLAGTVTSTSITSRERKFAANSLKTTKNEMLARIEGLSRAQVDFVTSKDRLSIKLSAYQLAIFEKQAWTLLQVSLDQPATPEKRLEIRWTDLELIAAIETGQLSLVCAQPLPPKKLSYQALLHSIEQFKSDRAEHLKYIRNTTEDLRNHFVEMPFGLIDCYQLCLAVAAYTNCKLQQIKVIENAPGFPRR